MNTPRPAISPVLCLAVVTLALAPAAAAEPPAAPELGLAPALSSAPVVCAAPADLQVALPAARPEPVPLAVAGTCTATADCWDGSHVTCTAAGSSENCSFTDSACPTQRGFCWSGDEGAKYCPACINRCTTPSCDTIDGTFCGKPGLYSGACQLGTNCNFHCICGANRTYLCP